MNDLRTVRHRKLVLSGTSAQELVGGLYRHLKSENKKFSLAYICRKAGMPSKGYLSDVINGRRQLHEKFAKGLADAFELEGAERKIFLLTIEKEREPSQRKREVLQKRILAVRDQKKSGVESVPSFLSSPVLFTRLFCALGLFTKPPTREKLSEIFQGEDQTELSAAIEQLVQSGAVTEKEGLLHPASASIMFGDAQGAEGNVRYVQSFLEYSGSQVGKWFPRKKESYIESSVVSVKLSQYRALLPKMKEYFDAAITELETAQGADDLVYFNIQVYPERGEGQALPRSGPAA